MSSDETQSALSRAYELVEAGNYSEARAVLDPILAANKDNADAWWIYAHAVTESETGRDALENVIRLDAQYPGASELLAQARERFPARPKITSLVRPVSVPDAPENLPEVGVSQSTRDTREQTGLRQPRRSTLPLIAVLVLIVVVAAWIIFLLTQNGAAPSGTPTSVAIAQTTETESVGIVATAESTTATDEVLAARAPTITPTTMAAEATSETTAEPTEAATTDAATAETAATQASAEATSEATTAVEATVESAAESFALIEQALSAFPIAESGVGEVETSLGNTLLVTACTTPGRAMRSLLPQVMNTLAEQSPSLDGAVEALGVRMLDCSANTALLTIATDLATAQRYAAGELSDSEFAATWQPQ